MDDSPISTGPLKRQPQSWGDEFRNAYRQAKMHWPDGAVTYKAIAERISRVVPVSHTSILRLGYLNEVPESAAQRQMAYLALMAMGFDPTDFGLEPSDRALRGMTDIELRKILDPAVNAVECA